MADDPYYLDHEFAYRSIRARGEVGWQTKTLAEFRDPSTERVLRSLVEKHLPVSKGKRALDVGCGSGPTAHLLVDFGFEVVGIDVATSAIELAKEMATRFKKSIQFRVADVVHLEGETPFDLIYDSHCFHCIVLEEDRRNAFAAVRSLLTPSGIFILDTMAYRDGAEFFTKPEPLRFDADFILWHRTKRTYLGVASVDGETWCPQRRIYPVETLLGELSDAGLAVVDSRVEDQGPREPYMLRAVCRISK